MKSNVRDLQAGYELDKLIAVRVFGWAFNEAWGCIVPKGHPAPPLWIPDPSHENYAIMNVMNDPSYPYSVKYTGDRPVAKEYSTSIEDAWEILTFFRNWDSHWSPTVSWDDDDGLSEGFWTAHLYYYGEMDEEFEMYSSYADTPALAICRVALLPDPLGEYESDSPL